MELLQLKCPACKSYDIHSHTPYTTKNHGIRVIYQCNSCLDYFSETKNTFMEGLKTPMSGIWLVIKARTDGMGLNAATRTFEFAKNTILSWERKFRDLHRVLFLYTLVHQFIEVIIEGDEAYTKVHHHVPPHESSGWTIVLMDRASRFIWELDCGSKDRQLFKKAIATLEQIVSRTNDLSLLTDGERRYGNLLFEVCYELVKNGKRGTGSV
jgi:transposase-like protein